MESPSKFTGMVAVAFVLCLVCFCASSAIYAIRSQSLFPAAPTPDMASRAMSVIEEQSGAVSQQAEAINKMADTIGDQSSQIVDQAQSIESIQATRVAVAEAQVESTKNLLVAMPWACAGAMLLILLVFMSGKR